MTDSMQVATRPPQLLQSQRGEKAPTQFLTFSLGGEVLALEIRFVKEILQYGSITEVPLSPPAVRGVMNLRGAVVPVIDLSVRFGRVPTSLDRRTCIVVIEVEEEGRPTVMGIVVDHVSEVLEIAETDIDPPPAFGSTLRTDFIRGVGHIGGRFVILLEIERVLSAVELALLPADKGAGLSEP